MNLQKAIDAVNSAKTEIQNVILDEIKGNRFGAVKGLANAQQKVAAVGERLETIAADEKERAAEAAAKKTEKAKK